MSKLNTLIYFIDGGTWKLLDPWINQGHLPYFKKVKDGGSYGIGRTVYPPITVPAIPSFYTGLNPIKIGVFNFTDSNGKVVNSHSIKQKKMWDYLSDYGLKSLIVNLPLTYPPLPLNGVMISGSSLVPQSSDNFVYPSELKQTLDGYPDNIEYEININNSQLTDEQILNDQKQITQKRLFYFNKLLKTDHYDFALFFIKGSDVLQHLFWFQKEKILDYYKVLDDNLGNLMEEFEPKNLFILSDHGFAGPREQRFYLNLWLNKNGYIKYNYFSKYYIKIRKIYKLFFALGYKYIKKKREKIKSKIKLQGVKVSKSFIRLFIRNSKTPFYFVCQPYEGIKINHKYFAGHSDIEQKVNELVEKLKTITFNNEPVVKEVILYKDLFHQADNLFPEIIILPYTKFKLRDALGKKVFFPYQQKRKIGSHDYELEGIFVAYGENIKAGFHAQGVSLIDILPTILALNKIPIPKDLDGKILEQIFKDPVEVKYLNEQDNHPKKNSSSKNVYSKSDEQEIKNRLKDLGYLDN